MAFDGVILELVEVARRAGLRMGISEALDAQRAASVVGLSDRRNLRSALRATMAKREVDRVLFDRVFDSFFRIDGGGRRGVLDRIRASGASPEELSDVETMAMAVGAGSGAGGGMAVLLAGDADLDQRIQVAMRAANVNRMTSPMQVGLLSLRTLEALGVNAQLDDAIDELREDQDALADALAAQVEALRRAVRERVRQDFERRNPDRLVRSRSQRLEREALAALSRDELEQVSREVRRLGQLLRDRLERRRRRTRRGRLDVRQTIRASFKSGGIPFRPVYRRRRRDRPELFVLCDISDSVRAASRFLLVLVYAMQEAFSRTRSFVFVRDVGETTDLFRTLPAEEAIAKAFIGDAVSVGSSSDYGRVLGTFVDAHREALNQRTTVVILGDARSNQLDPNVAALQEIASRTARVIWLNPEPSSSWGFGDSEMDAYRPHCRFAHSVRSLGELRAAMEQLSRVVLV